MAVLGCRLRVTPAMSLIVSALGFRPTPSPQLLQQAQQQRPLQDCGMTVERATAMGRCLLGFWGYVVGRLGGRIL